MLFIPFMNKVIDRSNLVVLVVVYAFCSIVLLESKLL